MIGVLLVLQVILIVLRLLNKVQWNWNRVFCPLYIICIISLIINLKFFINMPGIVQSIVLSGF